MKHKNLPHRLRKLALSFYCITAMLICQAFWPFSTASAASSVNSFHFSEFTADYYLYKAEDGTSRLRVEETLVAEFPKNSVSHGITRVIPYTNQDGQNLTMETDDYLNINVKHNSKKSSPYQVEQADGYFTVYLGDPDSYVRGTQTYELEYEFRNVITEFTEDDKTWQELYWDTNGNDWQQRFDSVTARIHFEDQEIANNFNPDNISCYVGRYGAKGEGRCKITITEDGVEFNATKLSSRENLTFDLEFAAGTFMLGKKIFDYRQIAVLVIEIAVVIILAIIFLNLFRQTAQKRKFYKNRFVAPEYTPPHGYTVAEMGENYLQKGRFGSTKTATLLELATSHKIELVQKDSHSKKHKEKWSIIIKTLNLTAEQSILLKVLAGGNTTLYVGKEIILKNHGPSDHLAKLTGSFDVEVRDSLRKKGLLEVNPKKPAKNTDSKTIKSTTDEPSAKNPTTALIVFSVAWFFVSFFTCIILSEDIPPYLIIAGGWPLFLIDLAIAILILVTTFILSLRLSPYYTHTEKGLEYSRYLDGLKLYIKMAEQERLQLLQSVEGADTSHQGIVKLYEKLLPYAALFKMEKSWLNEMAKYYKYSDVTQPNWYVGVGAFSVQSFAHAISSASSHANTVVTHSSISNSSSGFSGGGGGGFSGGGGGGGGGGGW